MDDTLYKSSLCRWGQYQYHHLQCYCLNKHLTEPINPVQVTFHGIDINSTDANSIAHDKINITPNIHTPKGSELFNNNVKNFYFARVVSQLDNYPRVNINISPLVRTPLNVDIYCQTHSIDYCMNRKIFENSSVTSTTREANGWYLSKNHNGMLDGNVTNLVPAPAIVDITANMPINNLILTDGANGRVMAKFNIPIRNQN